MPKVEIGREKCKGCRLCVVFCPKACIKSDNSINKRGANPVLFIDKDEKCTGCSFCAVICPDLCITVYK